MPKKIVRKPLKNTLRSRGSSTDSQVNFTFFKSKMFLSLVAIALLVIVFAIFSSMNSKPPTSSADIDMPYRIDTSSLQNDPSATNVINP